MLNLLAKLFRDSELEKIFVLSRWDWWEFYTNSLLTTVVLYLQMIATYQI